MGTIEEFYEKKYNIKNNTHQDEEQFRKMLIYDLAMKRIKGEISKADYESQIEDHLVDYISAIVVEFFAGERADGKHKEEYIELMTKGEQGYYIKQLARELRKKAKKFIDGKITADKLKYLQGIDLEIFNRELSKELMELKATGSLTNEQLNRLSPEQYKRYKETLYLNMINLRIGGRESRIEYEKRLVYLSAEELSELENMEDVYWEKAQKWIKKIEDDPTEGCKIMALIGTTTSASGEIPEIEYIQSVLREIFYAPRKDDGPIDKQKLIDNMRKFGEFKAEYIYRPTLDIVNENKDKHSDKWIFNHLKQDGVKAGLLKYGMDDLFGVTGIDMLSRIFANQSVVDGMLTPNIMLSAMQMIGIEKKFLKDMDAEVKKLSKQEQENWKNKWKEKCKKDWIYEQIESKEIDTNYSDIKNKWKNEYGDDWKIIWNTAFTKGSTMDTLVRIKNHIVNDNDLEKIKNFMRNKYFSDRKDELEKRWKDEDFRRHCTFTYMQDYLSAHNIKNGYIYVQPIEVNLGDERSLEEKWDKEWKKNWKTYWKREQLKSFYRAELYYDLNPDFTAGMRQEYKDKQEKLEKQEREALSKKTEREIEETKTRLYTKGIYKLSWELNLDFLDRSEAEIFHNQVKNYLKVQNKNIDWQPEAYEKLDLKMKDLFKKSNPKKDSNLQEIKQLISDIRNTRPESQKDAIDVLNSYITKSNEYLNDRETSKYPERQSQIRELMWMAHEARVNMLKDMKDIKLGGRNLADMVRIGNGAYDELKEYENKEISLEKKEELVLDILCGASADIIRQDEDMKEVFKKIQQEPDANWGMLGMQFIFNKSQGFKDLLALSNAELINELSDHSKLVNKCRDIIHAEIQKDVQLKENHKKEYVNNKIMTDKKILRK